MNYIKRTEYGIEIDQITFTQTGLIQYINNLCLNDGSSYSGRLNYSKKILGNHKNPIYINDDLLLIPSHSTRRYECVCINYFLIDSIIESDGKSKVIFQSSMYILIDISPALLKKQLKRAQKLVNVIQKRKCLHAGIINRFYI